MTASKLTKNVNADNNFTKSVFKKIERLKSLNSIAINCGYYSCNSNELEYTEKKLIKSGFSVSYGFNSHGVKTLIIKDLKNI